MTTPFFADRFPFWLAQLATLFEVGLRPRYVESPQGKHGIEYDTDEDGLEYATVGFNLPEGVYAEIEDGTYGELQGFRIYLRNDEAHDNEEHDNEECDVCGNRAIVSLNPPRCLDHLPENEHPIPESSQHQGEWI